MKTAIEYKTGDIIRLVERGEMLAWTVREIPYDQVWVVVRKFVDQTDIDRREKYRLKTLDRDGKLYGDSAFPYMMSLVESPTDDEMSFAARVKSKISKSERNAGRGRHAGLANRMTFK